ncbi:hypothetical protein ACEXQB_001845 [Herbiconiux sp. P18]|uniref:hypothetical protein n=1 Tax=Herbiconiux liangxiaofengii TaxID=3342795 RepID=UPI0035BAD383
MGEVLHAGALLPAAVGACCTVGARRSGRVAAVVSAGLMLLAMLDANLRLIGLSSIVWAALLLLVALGGAAAHRMGGRGRRWAAPAARASPTPHEAAMAVHGRIGLIVMAGLLLAMVPMGSGTAGAGAGFGGAGVSMHHGSAGAGGLLDAVAVGTLVYVGYSAVLGVRWARRRARLLPVLEVSSMGCSALLMLLPLALP